MAQGCKIVILAAGQGTRLRPLTDSRPKALVEVGNHPLLEWQIKAAREAGIEEIVVVGGYRAEMFRPYGVQLVISEHYATTNMVQSLFVAEPQFGTDFIMSYGDIVYGAAALKALLAKPRKIGVVVDRQWRAYWERRFSDVLSDAESLELNPNGSIRSIGQKVRDVGKIEAQYIGLARFSGEGVAALQRVYRLAQSGGVHLGKAGWQSMYMTDLLQGMIDLGIEISAVPIDGGWMEIDNPRDLALAETLLEEGRLAW